MLGYISQVEIIVDLLATGTLLHGPQGLPVLIDGAEARLPTGTP